MSEGSCYCTSSLLFSVCSWWFDLSHNSKYLVIFYSSFICRDITLPTTKVCLVKAMDFPVVMYGCESWTIKKAEHQRIDAFELRCWRRLLRVPWTARRSNTSILKEISPGCSLEGLMLKLETPILRPPDAKRDWGQEEKGMTEDEMVGWHHWLDGHDFGWSLGVGDGQGGLACCGSWGCKESDTTEWMNWIELNWHMMLSIFSYASLSFVCLLRWGVCSDTHTIFVWFIDLFSLQLQLVFLIP